MPRKMARKNNRSSAAVANGSAHLGNDVDKSESKAKDDEQCPLLLVDDKNGTVKIRNTATHDSMLEKAAIRELADTNQEDVNSGQIIETDNVCAFCQLHDEEDSMGNLFGPYVVKAPPLSIWPTFLCQEPNDEVDLINKVLKIWMHARCALWADGVQLVGARIENVDEKMTKFWAQRCSECRKTGAAVKCVEPEGYLHYPCAIRRGFKMRKGVFNCCK
ncbi:hypothetical protein QR680_005382 [Steinernema hermaphroditum]|uniref:PHD-type domain-containing protein n=1 Tax=Steinernema hermaphroditum TaxID=289476 RepID=A0AA39HTZ9_9BILA|nr:hypothetical protein QR680_005382 [Steinernema hermaphroditum]